MKRDKQSQIGRFAALGLGRWGCAQRPGVNYEIRNGSYGGRTWEATGHGHRIGILGPRCPLGRREGMFEQWALTSLLPDGKAAAAAEVSRPLGG